MSFEVFEQLEGKVQQALDTIALLNMELEELKEKNVQLKQEIDNASDKRQRLMDENTRLLEEQNAWQERLRNLLGKMDEVN